MQTIQEFLCTLLYVQQQRDISNEVNMTITRYVLLIHWPLLKSAEYVGQV